VASPSPLFQRKPRVQELPEDEATCCQALSKFYTIIADNKINMHKSPLIDSSLVNSV